MPPNKEKTLGPLFGTVALLGLTLVLVDRQLSLTADQKMHGLCAITLVAVLVMFFSTEAIPQSLAYHNFADQRCLCCVPNTLDVLSNLPFAAVSAFGLDHVCGGKYLTSYFAVPPPHFINAEIERPLWILWFVGIGLVSIGSGYYHWKPNNGRLVWDRLPMTIGFMAVLSTVIQETTGKASVGIVISLVIIGVTSVFYWHVTDDLRLYALVQFYSLSLLPLLMILFPSPYKGALPDYMCCLLLYIAAKIAESKDKQIFVFTGKRVSGHTIKHLLAGGATGWSSVMLIRRSPK